MVNRIIEANLLTFGQWRKIESATSPHDANHVSATTRLITNSFSEYSETTRQVLVAALTSSPMKEVSFRVLALESVRNLAMVNQLLGDNEIASIVRAFDDIVIREDSYGKDELKAAAIDALVDLAHQKPQLLIETAFPDFMAQLPDTDKGLTKPYVPVLEAFAKMSAETQVFKTITVRLKNKLYSAARQNASAAYVTSILSALLYAFTNGSVDLSNPANFGTYYADIALALLKDTRTPDGDLRQCSNLQNVTSLDIIGRICNSIVRDQPWVAQTEICRNVYTIFQTQDVSSKAPFNVNDPTADNMLISTHLLAALQREARPHLDINSLLSATISFANQDQISPAVRQTAIRQVSLLVNKFVPNSETDAIIQSVSSLVESAAVTSTAVHLAFAILRGAVLRTHRTVPTLLDDHLLPLLTDEAHGGQAARLFSTLLTPDDLLSKANHCQIFNIHKQRFFALTVPHLITIFRAPGSSDATKRNVLVALSGILYWIPYTLLRQQNEELERLLPLLLQSLTLNVDDADVKPRAIALFERILLEDAKVVQGHIGSLVSRLLDLATSSGAAADKRDKAKATGSSSPKTRAASLACLASFVSSFRAELLLPQKHTVVRRLMGALDDPRRAVRAEAVRCRRAWAGVGGADEED